MWGNSTLGMGFGSYLSWSECGPKTMCLIQRQIPPFSEPLLAVRKTLLQLKHTWRQVEQSGGVGEIHPALRSSWGEKWSRNWFGANPSTFFSARGLNPTSFNIEIVEPLLATVVCREVVQIYFKILFFFWLFVLPCSSSLLPPSTTDMLQKNMQYQWM